MTDETWNKLAAAVGVQTRLTVSEPVNAAGRVDVIGAFGMANDPEVREMVDKLRAMQCGDPDRAKLQAAASERALECALCILTIPEVEQLVDFNNGRTGGAPDETDEARQQRVLLALIQKELPPAVIDAA